MELLEPMFIAKDGFDLAYTMQLIILIINILVGIVLGICFPIMSLLNLCGYDLNCISGDGENEYKRINKISKIISYSCKAL